MKTVISHSLQKISFGSIMVENAYFLSYPNEVSKFRKFPHYQLINYKWKFLWQQVEEPGLGNQHSEDSCHLKQEELVLCNCFYNIDGETYHPPDGGLQLACSVLSFLPSSQSLSSVDCTSISLCFNSRKAISLKWLFSNNLGTPDCLWPQLASKANK